MPDNNKYSTYAGGHITLLAFPRRENIGSASDFLKPIPTRHLSSLLFQARTACFDPYSALGKGQQLPLFLSMHTQCGTSIYIPLRIVQLKKVFLTSSCILQNWRKTFKARRNRSEVYFATGANISA